ncbi:MAG: hypothetical protein VYB34_05085 [Planctomycetota bacterium]|nr:hypothetical protein [Planctomycetota bacterium]
MNTTILIVSNHQPVPLHQEKNQDPATEARKRLIPPRFPTLDGPPLRRTGLRARPGILTGYLFLFTSS